MTKPVAGTDYFGRGGGGARGFVTPDSFTTAAYNLGGGSREPRRRLMERQKEKKQKQ